MGKKLLLFLIVITLLIVGYTKYIRMVSFERELVAQWMLIESEYRHKSDIIYELSEFVSSSVNQEIPVVDRVRLARNAAATVKVSTDEISEESLEQFRVAFRQLIDLQLEIFQLSQDYPEINDSQEYRELVAELDGTEIRIANERRRLNEQVAIYNKYINGFFNLAIAQVFGFREWPVFTPILGE